MPTPRAFITGVGGQDGSLLAALLLDKGYEVAGVVRRDPAAYAEALAPLEGRVDARRGGPARPRVARRGRCGRRGRRRSTTSPPRRSCPRSWDEPILTAEFAAVGATSMLEAIREVDPAIRFYQASSSEIFGEPRETPQTEETAPSPLTPYGVAKAYAHFIAGELPAPLRDVHVLRDPLQPRVARCGRSTSSRARSSARRRRSRSASSTSSCSATSPRAATGGTPATTCARCG